MTTPFLLDFTDDGVRLLRRGAPDTEPFGEIRLDDPHFDTRMEDLRKEAEAEIDGPVTTELLIPHTEVLFLNLEIEPEEKEARETAIRAELDGLTPYDLADLRYVWKARGKGKVALAAVARETLKQAEDFAAAHGLNPQSFGAAPRKGVFDTGVALGKTSIAGQPLPPTAAQKAAAEAAASRPAQPAPSGSDGDETDKAPPADDAAKQDATPPAKPDAADDSHAAAARPATEAKSAADEAKSAADAKPARQDGDAGGSSDMPDRPARAEAAPKPAPMPAPTAKPAPRRPEIDPEPNPVFDPKRREEEPAEPASPAPAPVRNSAAEGIPEARHEDADAAPTPSFSSRRAPAAAGPAALAAASAAPATSSLDRIASRIAMLPDGGAGPARRSIREEPDISGVIGSVTPAKPATGGPKPVAEVKTSKPAPSADKRAPAAAAPSPKARQVKPPEGKPDNGKPAPAVVPPPSPVKADPPMTEAEALTVFGARNFEQGSRLSSVLPIVIGVIVALVLALVIWSAVFLLGGEADVDPTETSALAPAAEVPETAATDADPVAPETAPDRPEIETAADLPDIDAPDTAPDPDAAGVDDPLDRPAGASETGRYAATGVDAESPPVPNEPASDTVDEVGGETVLSAPRSDLAEVAVPDLSTVTAPPPLIPPPPAGTRFDLDEAGRVIATPEGVVSPAGVRVTAGRPALVPPATPARPARIVDAPDATAPQDAPETNATAESQDESQVVIPITDGTPPRVPPLRPGETTERSDDAADPAPETQADTEVIEVARADTVEGASAASLLSRAGVGMTPRARPTDSATPEAAPADAAASPGLPRARPASLSVPAPAGPDAGAIADALAEAVAQRQEPAAPADDGPRREAEAAAAAAAAASALAAIVPQVAPAPTNPAAVARSIRPTTRPATVERRATQQPAAQPVRVAQAAAVVRPSGPTGGSVAARATEANVLRLNQINLIGVYGSANSRRALIRLPSGRFQKVKVGDRVDGGQVRAIGDNLLQYQKGSRVFTLQMPAG